MTEYAADTDGAVVCVEIPLNRKPWVALVDHADAEMVRQHRWHVARRGGVLYAKRNIRRADGRPTGQYMHSLITGERPVTTPRVIGLDLSLVSTGVASSLGWVERVRSHPSAEVAAFSRLRIIRARVLEYALKADLVVVEGLSLASKTGQHLTRAGLWHVIMEEIDAASVPWAEVSPAALKRYATGRGGAHKDEVLAAVVRRFHRIDITGNDEADALSLAAMGADYLGHPIVDMPQTHRAALAKVHWPEMNGES